MEFDDPGRDISQDNRTQHSCSSVLDSNWDILTRTGGTVSEATYSIACHLFENFMEQDCAKPAQRRDEHMIVKARGRPSRVDMVVIQPEPNLCASVTCDDVHRAFSCLRWKHPTGPGDV